MAVLLGFWVGLRRETHDCIIGIFGWVKERETQGRRGAVYESRTTAVRPALHHVQCTVRSCPCAELAQVSGVPSAQREN